MLAAGVLAVAVLAVGAARPTVAPARRRASTVFGPRPGTRSSASTDGTGPDDTRSRRIARSRDGPMPGRSRNRLGPSVATSTGNDVHAGPAVGGAGCATSAAAPSSVAAAVTTSNARRARASRGVGAGRPARAGARSRRGRSGEAHGTSPARAAPRLRSFRPPAARYFTSTPVAA